MSKARSSFLRVVEKPLEEGSVTIPNHAMRQITQLLSRMVVFPKFRGYGIASIQEPDSNKAFIYLGYVGGSNQLLFNPTDKPLVLFEFRSSEQKAEWHGGYCGQAVTSTDIADVLKHVIRQIAQREKLPYAALTGQKAGIQLVKS